MEEDVLDHLPFDPETKLLQDMDRHFVEDVAFRDDPMGFSVSKGMVDHATAGFRTVALVLMLRM